MNEMIAFPHLGITFPHVGQSISLFGFEIAYYGIVIACAMMAGIGLAMWTAKRTGQDPDQYFNFAIIAIAVSLLGARFYYVFFSWDYYSAHPLEILNFRAGGLAIYGGVIAGILTAVIYCRVKHLILPQVLDTACLGLILGQVIGRWGNFFNREAFGGYTDGLLAMQLPLDAVRSSEVTQEAMEHAVVINGVTFIQVHPTFLYESLWNLVLLILLITVTLKVRKRFQGEVFLLYLAGYGIGRAWIEGLRTDQLLLPGTRIPVSLLLSCVLAAGSILTLLIMMHCTRKKTLLDR